MRIRFARQEVGRGILRDALLRLVAALLFLSAADVAMGRNRTIHAPPAASALPEVLDIGDIYFDCKEEARLAVASPNS